MKNDKCDIVIGSRFKGDKINIPSWREKGIQIINKLVSLDGGKISDTQSGFRAYSRKAIKALSISENGMGVSTEILIKAKQLNLKICEIRTNVFYHKNSSTHNPIYHGFSVILSIKGGVGRSADKGAI